ncbi:MAG: DUF3426 domain-containing protein, partial [Desulfuromonadales bacterium]|nr:DUF3426 domain-containing protein [Desulfuromonadales bacterium]
LADEKVKPGGTKVRCSKCKEVFTVIPPEPEPFEDTVDFDSSNMEKITGDLPDGVAPDSDRLQASFPQQEEQPTSPAESHTSQTPDTSKQADSDELDFSSLESEMAKDTGSNDELADNFFFADTTQPAEATFDKAGEDRTSAGADFSVGDVPAADHTDEKPTDFSVSFAETKEPDGPLNFDFSEDEESDSETTERIETDFSTEESTKPSEFSFTGSVEESQQQDGPGEFAFEDEGDDSAYSFDQAEEEATPAVTQKYSEPGEFSFDDDDSVSAWSEEPADDETSFSFEEAGFDSDIAPATSSASASDAEGLQFGEIDFASEDESGASSFQSNDDFPKSTMPLEMETEASSRSQSSPSPSPRNDDDIPLPPPPPAAKKSSLSRILVLLVLLLLILGGAAGYLFMQEGSLNLNTITRYLPFLQEYIGEPPVSSPGDRIGITIIDSSYVNGQAGQMLVIQGAAVNNHSTTRSAITVKGVLLDATGQPLLQQTVFCGNKLDNSALKSMSFAAIEEAMNNQFGDGLSNMNVSAGATIPFTIVFRNLPTGIASINVEVVDSKPGAS